MKYTMKFFKLLLIVIICYNFFQCTENHEDLDVKNQQRTLVRFKKTLNIPRYSTHELIIKYNSRVTKAQKQALRNLYGVVYYQICDLCDDESIEKWDFGNNVDVEDKKLSIQGGSGGPEGDITDVDYEFTFRLEGENDLGVTGTYGSGYTSQIVGANNGVTIAVLDTGIDANYPLFTTPFLYNSSGVAVSSELSGWDFVNHDDNCFDDYNLIHGTKVTYILNKKLNEEGIPHQILPVKVCNEYGVATYFNILCGLKYALPRANIVQMSLGWYGNDSDVNSIFSSLIEEYQRRVLIVTSAGNNKSNNDSIVHYPSSYPQRNILAIAASNIENDDIADFSNYGSLSVDFYAPGEGIEFFDVYGDTVSISGTSYSAPWVSAISARILYESGMTYSPYQIIERLTIIGVNESYSKPVKYNKLLN